MSNTLATSSPTEQRHSVSRTLIGTGAGNAVEWYDWAVYATFASFIASQLFSPADPSSAFLMTLAVFAVGFVARPLGGFLFGWIGDKVGRKASMTLSVALASLGSLAIALTPSYASIGAGASVLLVIARLVQGLAHGGELPSAQTYLSEMAPRERRGLWSSLIYVSGTTGILFGTLLGAVLSTVLSAEQMSSFGWRIPFAIGALFGFVALLMRSRMEESAVFEGEQRSPEAPVAAKPKLLTDMARHWRQALQVIGLTIGLTVVYYVWGVSTPAYAINVLGIDAKGALWAGVVANLVFIAALPLWGRLSDKIGRRPVLLISAIGTIACYFPAGAILQNSAVQLAVSMSIMLIFIAGFAAIGPAVYAELFPTSVRTIGVAVPYAICVAAFGGTAAYLQAGFETWFGEAGRSYFGFYTLAMLLVTVITVIGLKETRGKDLSEQ
ncbi:MFS transporter [Glutamicibacter sp. PS]|uniref:MFS transporter n=1 Tax=Glutamicibacter sp. PS TaxID=3075634 RepID=UPI00283C1ED3|nr:MFS transporter [Glutamicibacter sp. PS]MDR4533380.1 MFS transporter [Glutamicibacter sp. PS]